MQQVEGAGEERHAQRLHQEDGIEHERRASAARAASTASERAAADQRRRARRFIAQLARPNRPAGFTSSTIAMMTKITVLDASG